MFERFWATCNLLVRSKAGQPYHVNVLVLYIQIFSGVRGS